MIEAGKITGIHKKDGALVIDNGETTNFCRDCLGTVPDSEIEFNEERPCVICQMPGGPVVHARAYGMKHDYVTPQPEVIPFSDAELAESRAQIDNMKNSRLKMQIQRLYATVDYWIEEARREAELRQPAIDERDIARRALKTLLEATDDVIQLGVTTKFEKEKAKHAERVRAFSLWPFPLPMFGRIVNLVFEIVRPSPSPSSSAEEQEVQTS